jgi:hypothetical protein
MKLRPGRYISHYEESKGSTVHGAKQKIGNYLGLSAAGWPLARAPAVNATYQVRSPRRFPTDSCELFDLLGPDAVGAT